MFRFQFLFLFLLFCLSHSGQAQSEDAPKLGLVLSGGGAKGLAHIGILKRMEDLGIYPDYVTGTSMGSVVGGLYALGYSAYEIDSIAKQLDWDQLLSNQIPYEDVAMEEKSYYGRYMIDLPLKGVKPLIPRGLVQGQTLSNLFSRLSLSSVGIYEFDSLPIPFRCIATDIESGQPVVLSRGSIAEAMRASMAIPGFFTPVELDSNLLIDGGLVHNFPVQEALDMGADIIIGINVSVDLIEKEELSTMADILFQASWVMSAYNSRIEKEKVDLLIEPDLTGFGTSSFNKSNQIVIRGEQTGDSLTEALIQLRDRLHASGKVFKKPVRPKLIERFSFDRIEIEGLNYVSPELIRGRLGIEVGDSVEVEYLNEQINILYGTRYFKKIHYRIEPRGNGEDLIITVEESPRAHLATTLHYNNEVGAGFRLNYTARNLFGKKSRLISELDLSENPFWSISYLRFLGAEQRFGYFASYSFLSHSTFLFENETQIAKVNYNRHQADFRIQTTNGSQQQFGIGISGHLNIFKQDIRDFVLFLDRSREDLVQANFFYKQNTLDRLVFPKKGLHLQFDARYSMINEEQISFIEDNTLGLTNENTETFVKVDPFMIFNFQVDKFSKLSEQVTIMKTLNLRYFTSTEASDNHFMALGGFYDNYDYTMPMWGVQFNQYQVKTFGYASLGVQWELMKDLLLQVKANYISTKYPNFYLDEDAVEENFESNDDLFSAGLQLAYRSILGPVILSIGRSEDSKLWVTGINVGFTF